MSFYSSYRWCVAPNCKNSTLKTPEKLFIQVPYEISVRYVWLELAGLDPTKYSTKSHLYLCEDHFNLEQDMENYMQYKIMGSVKKIKMKPNILPSKFIHSFVMGPSQATTSTSASVQPSMSTYFLEEQAPTEPLLPSTRSHIQMESRSQAVESTSSVHPGSSTSLQKADKQIQVHIMPAIEYKSVQANLSAHYRSKSTQVNLKIRHSATSPMKFSTSVATSPHAHDMPSVSGFSRPIKRKLCTLFEEKSDSEISFTPSISGSTSQDFSPTKVTTSDSTLPDSLCTQRDQTSNLVNTISKIKKKPRLYLGIPKELYFLIDIIQKHTDISETNTLLCLTKIRLNPTFSQIADDFGLSLSSASKIFSTTIKPISKVMSPFIKQLSSDSIKLNLPIAFRHRYHKITCIIDCLEIEIQKPTNAVHQALTWSEYKKANTIKYLVACTPDGLISYISAGYGGRVTDVTLFEHSKILDTLPSNTCILADRGFKHIEAYLSKKDITLMRPPSVASGTKLSKAEVRQTKQIASLRIHVERVIRRIREFAILKPHSVVNINFVHILDECIVTACALINLQDTLIK